MFYSHEILTDRQYGVATIWIVATIGSRSQTKRVTRKAIQEVEIHKAIEKIIEPGAPIALRLQGSLLFGVSGVFNQQCQYLLTDAQRVNFHMNAFFSSMTKNDLETVPGQGRRENLMLMDDPDFASGFIPQMPAFNEEMFLVNSNGRNGTQKTSSQMSPPSLASGSGSASSPGGFQLQLDVPHSDTPDHNLLPQGLQGLSSGQKPAPLGDIGDPFDEEELGPSADWGFNIDEDGNIVESAAFEPVIFGEELDLPLIPSIEGNENIPQVVGEQPQVNEKGDVFILGEQLLPDAEALPQAQREEHNAYEQTSPQADKQETTTQRKRKRKIIQPDERLEISRNVLRDWQDPNAYRENCCKPKRHRTTATEARKNAFHLTFGLGIANIGQNLGIPRMIHPLTIQYSGDSLFTAMTGLEVFNGEIQGGRKRGRSASEDIEDSEGDGRRVRPRLEEQGDVEQQQARGDQIGDIVFNPAYDGLEQLSEVGRERQSALDDHPSSAMPWNRNSSVIPGSSVRGQPAQFGRDQPSSPLNKRAGSVQDIVRYSDSADMGGGDLDFGFGGVGGDSNGSGSDQGRFLPLNPETGDAIFDKQQGIQYAREFLDREGANFLSYMEQTINESGERRHDDDFEKQRKWVAFDDVFVPARTEKATAAQAFYHVLGLVTKGRVFVEQVGMPQEPFGEIHVGVKIDAGT
ncbi:REC8 protein [Apiospora kogelbergensis]|uniref:REC8 protein n=1 Tax=Apiospora kogelbergensis TaxID=1337665 RepID=UPI00312EDA56